MLAGGAIGVVGILFVSIMMAFGALATWAEKDLDAYPFKDEDWLRYLLPSKFTGPDTPRIMLLGPSTVRENLRYDEFKAAFPGYTIVQGGISLGTMDDAVVALEYIENAYGAGALPDILVLGISPRFVAGIPVDRPFAPGINKYSTKYGVADTGNGLDLYPKPLIDGTKSTIRFLGRKQPERFRTAVFAAAQYWLEHSPTLLDAIDGLRRTQVAVKLNELRGYRGPPENSFVDQLDRRISPYIYSRFPPMDPDKLSKWLSAPASETWWSQVFNWRPLEDDGAQSRLEEVLWFVERRNIQLLIVNLPERDIARDMYRFDYQDYLDLVTDTARGTEFVNLREFLTSDEFYDAEHSTVEGSRRLSEEVIRVMREDFDVAGAKAN